MGLIELLLLAAALSMDAFAVAVCEGLKMQKLQYKRAALIAVFFGGFQGLMPVIGWLLGKQFERYIISIDHWIAFVLLAVIGGKMVFEALKKKDDSQEAQAAFSMKELLLLSIATSIDALAVGVTFAFLQTNIWGAASLIAVVTCLLSFGGVCIGHRFGAKYKSKAELAGGIVLICIGAKILLEHLGVLG